MFNYKPLAETLKRKSISLKDVAERAGLSESVLRSKMNNSEYVSIGNLDRLCEVLEVPIENIIQWQKGSQVSSDRVYINWEKVNEKSIAKGISLNALSEKCRLNKSTLFYARKRNSQLRLDIVKVMARTLGCKVDEILAVNGSASPKE